MSAVVAMLGPSEWAAAGGFVYRAANLAVRTCGLHLVTCTNTNNWCSLQAGALVATCLMELWPRAVRLSSSTAAAGAMSGVIATAAAAGISTLLTRSA